MQTIIAAIISILITSLSAYGLHSLAANHAKASFDKQLSAQAQTLTASCTAAQAQTEKVSHDYEQKISVLNARLASASSVFNNHACVSVTSESAAGHSSSSGSDKLAGSGNSSGPAIPGQTLLNLLAEGEHYRLQLIGCQDFLNALQEPGKD